MVYFVFEIYTCRALFFIYLLSTTKLIINQTFLFEICVNPVNIRIYLYLKCFSSPEPKVHVSFSDHLLSLVRLSVCPSVTFHILDFSKTTRSNVTMLGTKHSYEKVILKLFKGEIIAKQ